MTYGFQNNRPTSESQEKEQINDLFEQYEKEMRYLRNFSERTLRGYQEVFNRWQKYVGQMPSEKNLSQFVIGMRDAGLNTLSLPKTFHLRSVSSAAERPDEFSRGFQPTVAGQIFPPSRSDD